MIDPPETAAYVREFGRQHRALIIAALHYIDVIAPSWGIRALSGVNRRDFIAQQIESDHIETERERELALSTMHAYWARYAERGEK